MRPEDDSLLAQDGVNRRRALEAGSCIVEAPAGAGKTELLTQRLLMLLARVEAPEEIVAITFTRKAAAEMRSRLLESLALAVRGEMPEAAHKRITFTLAGEALAASAARGWGLLENPARLRITTIDAFCASLVRQMPLLSRFGGEPRLVEQADRHYREAARRTLALLTEDDDTLAAPVVAALAHLDNDGERLSTLLVAMLGRRDQWLGHAVNQPPLAAAGEALALLVSRELAAVAELLPAQRLAPLMPVAVHAAGRVAAESPIAALADWAQPLGTDPAQLPCWRGLAELLLTREGTPRKQITKAIGLPTEKSSEAAKAALKAWLADCSEQEAAALERVRHLPDPELAAEDWATVTALGDLLKLAAAQLWQVFQEAGEVDFIEVAQRALAALGDAEAPTDLALRLDYRIRHLLVDEFQDTNRAQVELLARLTAGWEAGDGRSLFLVGDPMQSIYRFRKAEVGLFLAAAGNGIGGLALERLGLARNNRSAPPVVAWINEAFGQLFPARDEPAAGAIAYRPFAAARPDLADAQVRVHALVGQGEADEARRVLAIVDATWSEDAARSIAVLVRAKTHLKALVAEIRRHRPDLRYTAVEIDPLADRQPVQDLLSLAHALHHRADRVHWLALLRAPWCGLTLADLHALAADDQRATLWSLLHQPERLERLSADGRRRLQYLTTVLAEAFAQRGRMRARRWLEGVWLRLGGPACLASAADQADVAALLDLADRLDAAGRFSPETLEEETGRLFAAPDAGADGRLQFMSIHKAKGLEFDTVVVPGLQRRGRDDEAPLMLWEVVDLGRGREGLVAAPLRRRGELPGVYDYLRDLERSRAAQEARRLVYVAATRAQRALHWLATLPVPGEGKPLKPPAGSLLDILWPVVAAEFEAAPRPEAGEAAAATVPPSPPPLRRLKYPAAVALGICRRFDILAPAAAQAAAELPVAGAAKAEGGEAEGGDPLDADVGTLVHAYLEMVVRDGLEAWPLARVQILAPAMNVWLARKGHGEAALAQGVARCQAALAATLGSDQGRWVLQARPDAAAELAVVRAEEAGSSTHIVDRTFLEDGVRWIIDYKTARVAGGDAALAAHAERYRPQLERYAGLFRDEGRRLRLAVFYTAWGRLLEIPFPT